MGSEKWNTDGGLLSVAKPTGLPNDNIKLAWQFLEYPNGPLYTELLDILSDPGLVKEDSSYEGNFDEDPPKVPKSLIPPQQGLVRLELKQNNEIIIKEMPSETFANVIYALQEEDKEKAIEILSNLGDKPYKEKYETSNISIKQFKKDEEQDEEKDVGDVQEKQKLTENFVVPIPNDFKITDLVNLTPSELVNALKIDQLGDLPIKSEPNMWSELTLSLMANAKPM